MNFMSWDKIEDFFKKIKKTYENNKFKKFFSYSNRIWLGSRYRKKLWNYHDIIENEEDRKKFNFTNNIIENIDRYLNWKKQGALILYSVNQF